MKNVKYLLWLLPLTIVHLTGHALDVYLNGSNQMLYCHGGHRGGVGFAPGTYVLSNSALRCSQSPNCAYNDKACTTHIIGRRWEDCSHRSVFSGEKRTICCIRSLKVQDTNWKLEPGDTCDGRDYLSFKKSQGKWVR